MSLPALLEQRLRLPVVAAPMFLVSNPQLVLACCRGGIVGSFPALNQRESSGFKAWLEEIEAGLDAQCAPYAVNLIVHGSNPRLQADLAICVEHRVPIVITSLGADVAYLGTRLIATQENAASEAYKQMLLDAQAADIIHTPAVSGVPASFMRQSLELAGYDLKQLQNKGEINYGEKLKPMDEEAKAWKTVWSAGQGVGGIGDLPSVEQLIARLDSEYRAACQQAQQLQQRWPR